MKLKSGYEERRARVEMIPLIDVVFLLLVFFIYAMLSMTVHRGLPIDLPRTVSSHVDRRDYVSVTVREDGSLYVGKRRVEAEELEEAVLEQMRGEAKKPVFINGDRDAKLERVVEVLDRLIRAGIQKVTIETEEKGP